MPGMQNLMQSSLWELLESSLPVLIGLVVSIFLLIWAVIRVRSWFRDGEDPIAQPHEMLLHFRDLHRQGSLSESEYRSIKSRLVETNKQASSTGSDTPRERDVEQAQTDG